MGASSTTARRTSPTHRSPTPWRARLGRAGRGLLAVVLAIVVLFLAATFVLPIAAGGSSFTVTEADRPSVLEDGTLALVRPVARSAIDAGDVVTIRGRGDGTWRVVVARFDGTLVVESVDGEAETISGRDVDGLVWLHLRDLGTVRDALTSVPGLAVIAALAVSLGLWSERARRVRVAAAATAPAECPVASNPPSPRPRPRPDVVRLQISLVVLGDVDDLELRYVLAETGGRVLREMGPQTRLVQLTGTAKALDAAEARLAAVAHLDAVHRSAELALEVPVTGLGEAAA